MHHKLTLEYDGGAFHGWQVQPGGLRTVAGELSAALRRVTGETPALTAAGRTDAGAHSLGQVVGFSLERDLAPERLRQALDGVLPADVAVVASEAAPAGFHARFHARRRSYRYLVENREARPALLRGRAWHVAQPLAVDAMRRAAALLVGRRDLVAFGADPAGRNTVRDLEAIHIRRLSQAPLPVRAGALDSRGGRGSLISFELRADAFLHGMVRRIVGLLVEVGLGRRDPGEAAGIVAARVPAPSRTAPAHGLYQLAVEY